jgi:hypothetical protein
MARHYHRCARCYAAEEALPERCPNYETDREESWWEDQQTNVDLPTGSSRDLPEAHEAACVFVNRALNRPDNSELKYDHLRENNAILLKSGAYRCRGYVNKRGGETWVIYIKRTDEGGWKISYDDEFEGLTFSKWGKWSGSHHDARR